MKKSIISALTTALVVGAASTTFAAANPFQDVPADHWAYDAVAQLAADGVIEGYGDGTYRGDQEITRYEMAQMVARAMAKGGNGADKALIDKLAAEFADELNSLGVRVSALEKKVDNVKWKGEIRFNFKRNVLEGEARQTQNYVQIRLKPSMTINKNWTGRAGIYYGGLPGNGGANRQNLDMGQNIQDMHVKWAYAEGVYGNTMIELGRLIFTTAVDEGMVYDDFMAGGRLTFGKDLKFAITLGRVDNAYNIAGAGTSSYQGAELTYNKDKLFAGLGYHHFSDKVDWNQAPYNAGAANIWTVGLGYRFNNFRLYGTYAQNTSGEGGGRKAANAQLDYKGANANKPGSFGITVGYRHLGAYAALCPTYDYFDTNMKGWYIGGDYAVFKNVMLHLGYADGKQPSNDQKKKVLYGRVRFLF